MSLFNNWMFLAFIFVESQNYIYAVSYGYDKYMIFLTFSEMEEKLALQGHSSEGKTRTDRHKIQTTETKSYCS